MSFSLDHVFILCDRGAPEGDALVAIGLSEGSSNRHPGQGTANRRFFFANAYLELLWVEDAEEASAPSVMRTGLLERWRRRRSGGCPFGIVLRGEREDEAPFLSRPYRPPDVPPGRAIQVAEGVTSEEPAVFAMSFGRRREQNTEPTSHGIPVHELTGPTVTLGPGAMRSETSESLERLGLVRFEDGLEPHLRMSFDRGGLGRSAELRPRLPLSIEW